MHTSELIVFLLAARPPAPHQVLVVAVELLLAQQFIHVVVLPAHPQRKLLPVV